jgi:hypothetical protein
MFRLSKWASIKETKNSKVKFVIIDSYLLLLFGNNVISF